MCILISHTFAQTQAPSTTTTIPTPTGSQTVTSKPVMTDGQISKILLTINQGEIEAAKWAKKHANNKDVKKSEMDKVYISQQMMTHQNALNHINNTLLPNATNPDLRAHLEKTRDDITGHLNHAQELQTKVQ